jgi:hypothetical protein
LLPFLNNPDYRPNLSYLIAETIDSSYVDTSVIAPYYDQLRESALTLNASHGGGDEFEDMAWRAVAVRLFAILPSNQEIDSILRSISSDTASPLRAIATIALVRHHRRVTNAQIERLGDSPDRIVEIIRALVAIGAEERIPLRWRDQETIAKGLVALWANDTTDDFTRVDSVEIVGTRQIAMSGRPMRVHLIRFHLSDGDAFYPAVVGPMPVDDESLIVPAKSLVFGELKPIKGNTSDKRFAKLLQSAGFDGGEK